MITGFEWIIKSRLAASAMPGLMGPIEDDVDFFGSIGIITVVTLTEKPVSPSLERFGFKSIHYPIPDMGAPRLDETLRLCNALIHDMDNGKPVLVHCKGGLGRTGTIICAVLICRGKSAEQALAEIRKVNKMYVQSAQQEQFLRDFEDYFRNSLQPVHKTSSNLIGTMLQHSR
ncbi:dual specificity protein phosphatase family protein [bacterium]|nr:dual specificity protein phosphatase family protein [bacterium]